jgi:hypothetical protein
MAKMAERRNCVGLEATEVAKSKSAPHTNPVFLTSYDTPIIFSEGVD